MCDPLHRRPERNPNFLLLLLSLFCPLSAGAGLPSGWTDADIGGPGLAGSAAYTNGNWTVTGGGSDIWNTADQFNFVSTAFLSDGSIVAKVTSLQNSDPGSGWSRAGVMFRNDTTAGSANVAVMVSAENGVVLQWRDIAADTSVETTISGVAAPVWLQLVRSSDNYAGYYSYDGSNWLQIGTVQLLLNGPLLAGLAVTAHNNSALNTATFTNVSLTSQTFGVYREMWTNLNSSLGDTLVALTNSTYNTNWPNHPVASWTHVFTNFETEINLNMNYYGQRVRAFVVPPVTGPYIFWIASDDTSDLFVSTDENPANMAPIASVSSWTSSEQWTEFASQQSNPIMLQAGCRYFIEALMQQGGGGNNLSVRWQLPNGTYEQPMAAVSSAGTLMIPSTGVNSLPGIYSQTTNTTVVENQNAVFAVLATNQAAVSYRWFSQGIRLTNSSAGQAVYTLSNVSLSLNNGQTFTCVVSNSLGTVTSAPIVLTVLADTVAPTVQEVYNVGTTNVAVVFSKGVTAASATNLANYVFTNGLAVTAAALASDNVTVTLTTAPLAYYSNYWMVINGILSRAATPVMIASNTVASFVASPYVAADIGAPPIASTTVASTNGVTVAAAGGGIGGLDDQFNFQYELVSGNFDVNVCLAGLGLSDVWAEAGLMARAGLSPGAAFTASLATPNMAGSSRIVLRPMPRRFRVGLFRRTTRTPGCGSNGSEAPSPVLPATMVRPGPNWGPPRSR
ncbi:exported hypothetical protein [Verrucomicrobia bacterium]|nr:exported hypothetical protein [Verrucomicrobiota bacterium]